MDHGVIIAPQAISFVLDKTVFRSETGVDRVFIPPEGSKSRGLQHTSRGHNAFRRAATTVAAYICTAI